MTDKDYEEIYIPWDRVHKDSKALSLQLKDQADWKGIIAVTRGGMIPACLVARVLDIKMIETFCISTYDFKDQSKTDIPKALNLPNGGAGWIVIDDMVDTGGTYKEIKKHLPNATYGVLYTKPLGKPHTDYAVFDFKQSDWLHCPWETDADTGAPQGY